MTPREAARVIAVLGTIGCAGEAAAQEAPNPVASRRTAAIETRRATPTSAGDTGLWFVPSGEILPRATWSVSFQRINADHEQGFTDVSDFPVTFGLGLADRVEIFSAWPLVRRIDRDVRPLFVPTPSPIDGAGVLNEYPFVSRAWSGNQLGDLSIGAKINLTSQHRRSPAAVALRGTLKIPTADEADGAGTGKPDVGFDAVVSAGVNERLEVAAFGGVIVRADPAALDLLNGIRWGVGASTPLQRGLRVTAEVHGEMYLGESVEVRGPTLLASASPQESPVVATLGATWERRNGLFAGAALSWSARVDARSDLGAYEDQRGDSLGLQFRIGYHPGVRVRVSPAASLTPAPENRPPTVHARCEPCTVEPGRPGSLIADAADPDADPISFQWSAAAGVLGSRSSRETTWTAPSTEGPVPVTITVSDGRGGTATDAVTFYVARRSGTSTFLRPLPLF